MTTETNRLAGLQESGVTKSEQATASSAHARLNIPLNLDAWKALPTETSELLTWFHQYALDQGMSLKDCAEALDYDTTTIFRILKGTYEGSWPNIAKAVSSFRRIATERGKIQQNEFVPNNISQLIFDALDYAMANNSIALIVGESRQGKTVSGEAWRDRNNHGRSVFVTAPPYGGTKAFLRCIAQAVGANKNQNAMQMMDSIYRAFNKHRILIVDEAHRLLPGDRRSNPVMLEIVRDIHDQTDCAVGLLATERFKTELEKGTYMFEQVLGRIGMPVRLPRKMTEKATEPILRQYFRNPSEAVMNASLEIANAMGRLGVLVETLKVASRIASKAKSGIKEEHFFKAIAIRKQMMGEVIYAAK